MLFGESFLRCEKSLKLFVRRDKTLKEFGKITALEMCPLTHFRQEKNVRFRFER